MTALTVVYLKDTGHVLAAVTSAAPPDGAEPVKALVGSHLPWRGTAQAAVDVSFPASLLAAATVEDTRPDVSRSGTPLDTPLIDPLAFQVIHDPHDPAHPKVTKFPTISGTPTATLALAAATGLTVTLNDVPSTTSLPAVVVLQKVTTPAQAGSILPLATVTGAATGTTVVPSGFNAGETWTVFVFVQGMPPAPLGRQTL